MQCTQIIAPYKDGSGWSKASLNFIDCLSKEDIYIKNISFNTINQELPNHLKFLENKKSPETFGNTIFFLTPENIRYNDKYGKHIAYSFLETDTLRYSGWIERLSLMDEVWVPTEFAKNVIINSGFKKPVKIVPIPFDINKYTKKYNTHPLIEKYKNSDYLFYSIADMNVRKNINGLLVAFYGEFEPHESVNLVLKISSYQLSNKNRNIIDLVKDVWRTLNIKTHKLPIIIGEDSFITDEEISQIHYSCDSFVLPSHGEGLCIPIVDALGFRKTPIATNWSAMADLVNENNGYPINNSLYPCLNVNITGVPLYTKLEKWAVPHLNHLRERMRECYNNKDKNKQDNGFKTVCNFSYTKANKYIKDTLNVKKE